MSKRISLGSVLEHPCPECGASMLLRDSPQFGLFYGCSAFPACKATHGAHQDGQPLGIPANKETKKARIRAHEYFDKLWKDQHMSRSAAYRWMQQVMGLSEDEAHIGRFSQEQCVELESKVNAFFEDLFRDLFQNKSKVNR